MSRAWRKAADDLSDLLLPTKEPALWIIKGLAGIEHYPTEYWKNGMMKEKERYPINPLFQHSILPGEGVILLPIFPVLHLSIQLFENLGIGTFRQRVQPWKRGV